MHASLCNTGSTICFTFYADRLWHGPFSSNININMKLEVLLYSNLLGRYIASKTSEPQIEAISI